MGDVIEVSTTIAAPADAVYGALADITRMGEWSPECSGGRWLGGATAAAPGARFKGTNKNGPWRWSTTCTIEAADPGSALAWAVTFLGLPIARWSYRFAPDGQGGTVVTESWEDRRNPVIKLGGPVASGVGDRTAHNRKSMQTTLERVKQVVEKGGRSAS
jgi:uncharacterized protein YndB with AHSA1/START domain